MIRIIDPEIDETAKRRVPPLPGHWPELRRPRSAQRVVTFVAAQPLDRLFLNTVSKR